MDQIGVHGLPSYFFKINFNLILPSTPRSSRRSRSCSFPEQKTSVQLLSTCLLHTPLQSLSWFYHPYILWIGVKITMLLVMCFPLASSYFFFLRLKTSSVASCSWSLPKYILPPNAHTNVYKGLKQQETLYFNSIP
jgi:hypothetical protein